MIGYGILLCYVFLLFAVGKIVAKRFPLNACLINEYIFAGGKVSFGLLAPSIFISWVWVTTIIGAAEAGVRYGFSGGWAYSLGAAAAFAALIPIICKIKRMMPGSITFIDFLGARFSACTKDIYYIFALLLVVYLIVEQATGIALVFNGLFHVSFKKFAFITVVIAGVYVVFSGMRGVLYNELINFIAVSGGIIVFAYIIICHFDMQFLMEGMKSVQSEAYNNNYNPEALKLLSKSGCMYAFSAVIIALGQICVDPAYYLKAYVAKDEKTMKRAFLAGGVLLWIPLPIISAFVLGYVTLSQNYDFSYAVNISVDLSTKILTAYFGTNVKILFAALIFCIGMTSIIHCLIGIQSIFTLDYYKSKINFEATEAEKIKFGRVVSMLIAILCALMAITLEKISLLTIDTFSGIFFAAPCGAIIAGICSRKDIGNKAVISVVAGIIAGFLSWIAIDDVSLNWLYGTIISFAAPIFLSMLISFFTKRSFNFSKLLAHDFRDGKQQ